MGDTLCANLSCDPEALKKLNDILSPIFIAASFGHTSHTIIQNYYMTLASEINKENKAVAHQVRNHFSMVVNGLITIETNEETVAEEYPEALEFKGWATDDCIEFCNSHGLIDDLRKCRKALNDIFSNIINSIAEVDHYQEIDVDDEGHVVIRLEIESDRKTYREEYKTWVRWMVNNLSDGSRILFSLSIDRL